MIGTEIKAVNKKNVKSHILSPKICKISHCEESGLLYKSDKLERGQYTLLATSIS